MFYLGIGKKKVIKRGVFCGYGWVINADKFGKDNISYAYRITYRSLVRTLTTPEVDAIHKKLEAVTAKVFEAKIAITQRTGRKPILWERNSLNP